MTHLRQQRYAACVHTQPDSLIFAPPLTLSGVWREATPAVKRNLFVLFVCQALTNGSIVSSTALSSVIVVHITGSEALSGLPSAINFFAAALGAFMAGRVMAVRGRRAGLMIGYATGLFGAVFGAGMALMGNFVGFLIGGACVGVCLGTLQQARYAAAEMVPGAVRGRVIGSIISGSVFGSLIAALLTPPVQSFARAWKVPDVELVWFLAAGLLFLGLVLVGLFLHPDPSTLVVREASNRSAMNAPPRRLMELLKLPEIRLALVCLAVGQGVMTMLMVLTPLHAKHLGHGLPTISGLLTGHMFGMFAFSWLTGLLVDRLGRRSVAMLGGLQLMLAGFVATFATTVPEIGFSLFVLGLGWSFVNVAGSTLLADELRDVERARTQGVFDTLALLSGSLGAIGGGLVVASSGFAAIGWVGFVIAILPLVGAMITRGRPRPLAVSD
jgi:MFS family permease